MLSRLKVRREGLKKKKNIQESLGKKEGENKPASFFFFLSFLTFTILWLKEMVGVRGIHVKPGKIKQDSIVGGGCPLCLRALAALVHGSRSPQGGGHALVSAASVPAHR